MLKLLKQRHSFNIEKKKLCNMRMLSQICYRVSQINQNSWNYSGDKYTIQTQVHYSIQSTAKYMNVAQVLETQHFHCLFFIWFSNQALVDKIYTIMQESWKNVKNVKNNR